MMRITTLHKIDYRAIGNSWALSRDPAQFTPIAEIVQNDVPALEMAVGVFLFENFTILEREIFTSARNHVMWARTSRVDDPLAFTVPDEFDIRNEHVFWFRDQRIAMSLAKTGGAAQDEWRMFLPVLAHTTWVARHSYRDLLRLAHYFAYLCDMVARPLRSRMAKLSLLLSGAAMELVPITPLPRVGFDKLLNEKPLVSIAMTDRICDWRSIHVAVPLALRAQIVRHREIQFADDLFVKMCSPAIMRTSLHETIWMDLLATKDHWDKIISKRACWIAQAPLWQPILDEWASPPLPCADGKCPYHSDNTLRQQGLDPNPPCPRWHILHGTEDAQDETMKNAQRVHSKGRNIMWQDMIDGA